MNDNQDQPKLSEKIHNEMLTLYGVAVEDIERVKQWQWAAFYNSLVGQAAIFALFGVFSSAFSPFYGKALFSFYSVALGIIGILFVLRSERDKKRARERMQECIAYFTSEAQQVFEPSDFRKPRYHFWQVAILGMVVLLVVILMFAIGNQEKLPNEALDTKPGTALRSSTSQLVHARSARGISLY